MEAGTCVPGGLGYALAGALAGRGGGRGRARSVPRRPGNASASVDAPGRPEAAVRAGAALRAVAGRAGGITG